jgi:hypothetical protein
VKCETSNVKRQASNVKHHAARPQPNSRLTDGKEHGQNHMEEFKSVFPSVRESYDTCTWVRYNSRAQRKSCRATM